ncbi:LAMI_0B06502g1_1 [Lachancea mirantina]|uniref:LAMI_0B06502g1_1 n=1 Tax=Lachancea mirantina TaxID=1230905 RepID=A0A1G4IX23_9SACH|nr:LAMI_0B06502g1_1 [Lachancea mirantina]
MTSTVHKSLKLDVDEFLAQQQFRAKLRSWLSCDAQPWGTLYSRQDNNNYSFDTDELDTLLQLGGYVQTSGTTAVISPLSSASKSPDNYDIDNEQAPVAPVSRGRQRLLKIRHKVKTCFHRSGDKPESQWRVYASRGPQEKAEDCPFTSNGKLMELGSPFHGGTHCCASWPVNFHKEDCDPKDTKASDGGSTAYRAKGLPSRSTNVFALLTHFAVNPTETIKMPSRRCHYATTSAASNVSFRQVRYYEPQTVWQSNTLEVS